MQVHGINIVTMDGHEQYSTLIIVLAISKQVGFDFFFGSGGRRKAPPFLKFVGSAISREKWLSVRLSMHM